MKDFFVAIGVIAGLFLSFTFVYMFKNSPSVATLTAFIVGYFKLTDFNK